jgi:protein-S-isoprenylcysteine O-methyltransferase Ste14
LCVVWVISWWLAALWSDRAAKRPAVRGTVVYSLLTWIGAILLFRVRGIASGRLWRLDPVTAWVCVVVTIAGLAFCWWARLHIGRLWSTRVDRKADHRVVDSGPYAIVRHPIYFGISAAAVATAVISGWLTAFVGAGLLISGFWLRARLEERFLRETLDPGAYDAYRRRVPMLVPFMGGNSR